MPPRPQRRQRLEGAGQWGDALLPCPGKGIRHLLPHGDAVAIQGVERALDDDSPRPDELEATGVLGLWVAPEVIRRGAERCEQRGDVERESRRKAATEFFPKIIAPRAEDDERVVEVEEEERR